jgi:anthranilate synthase component 1
MRTEEKTKNSIVRVISGEKFTPYSLYSKLDGRALLESASFARGKARFSLILVKEAFKVQQDGGSITLVRDGETFPLPQGTEHISTEARTWSGANFASGADAPSGAHSPSGDILNVLQSLADQHRGEHRSFPFPAGGIGYLSYEFARHFDDVRLKSKIDSLGLPEAAFMCGNLFLIFDHYTDTISIVALNYDGFEINLERAVDETEERIHDLDFNYLSPSQREYRCIMLSPDSEKDRFKDGAVRIRREIKKGNILQGVLSRRVILQTEMPGLEAYRRLRSLNPSPYMFFLDFGSFQLFGSSPEMHVKVEGNRVITRPIAGTRRRGETREEDLALEKELLSDEKERAEHLMLVDLARNDLGRVCVPGTVEVTEFNAVEHYSHVMHIVSQVEGELSPDKRGIEAIRKTFPAGTVSGAPKIRAMEIVDSLEENSRSFYAGLVGYIEPDGSLDTCITIRSALRKDDLLILQAGAGIVWDSVPERELEETSEKLRALGKSLGMEV